MGAPSDSSAKFSLAAAIAGFFPKRRIAWVLLLIVATLVCALVVRGTWGWALVAVAVSMVVLLALRLSMHTRYYRQTFPGHSDAALAFAAMEQSPESMAVVDYDGRMLYANRTFLQRSGYHMHEIVGKSAHFISANGLSEEQRVEMRAVVERGEVWRSILTNRGKDGQEIQESVSIAPMLNSDGVVTGFMEIKQDITELMQTRQRLSQVLNFDALTLLPNRWALSVKLENMLQNAANFPALPVQWHALLLVDMDDFSKFNVGRGLEWADALLRTVAQKMQALLPAQAWVARTSGDEFAVILPAADITRVAARMQAYELARHLQRGLATLEVELNAVESVNLSFGVGITVFPFTEPARKRDSEGHIYRRASMALRQAKSQGLGQVHAFSEALQESTQRKLAVEHGLYEALANQHLQMYVQEQVDINGRVCGVEALLRWQPPDQPLVSPGVFIPVAEESELIVHLGDWMLEQAVDLLNYPLVRNTSMWVAVNISARQFIQPDFVDKIASLVFEGQLQADRLTLEVTESMVLSNVDDAIQTMMRLNALGVRCALDDFGTGYSSLSYLHQLPIHEIKIDQSFVHHLDPYAKNGTLVQALLMVAKSLQLRVVAEGVEEADQANLLHAWYPAILCQGYLYSRPVPVQQWLEKLQAQSLTTDAPPSEDAGSVP